MVALDAPLSAIVTPGIGLPPDVRTVPDMEYVTPPPRDANRSMRGFVIPFRESYTGTPVVVILDTVWSTVSEGKAPCPRSTAIEPAMWGEACEVPPKVYPAAVINAPGAKMERYDALLEKHVTLSAYVVESMHP